MAGPADGGGDPPGSGTGAGAARVVTGTPRRRRRLLTAGSAALALAVLAVLTNLVTGDGVLPASWDWTTDPVVLLPAFGLALLLVAGLAMLDQVLAGDDPPAAADADSVAALMRAQAAASESFPYRLLGSHGRVLAEVYVRQQMADAAAVGPTMSVESAMEQHRHLLVSGGAGCGKSTLAFQLTADLARAVLDPTGPAANLVPVRVSAMALAGGQADTFWQALRDAVVSEVGPLLDRPLEPELFQRPWQGVPWLLIVDGIDEVVDGARREGLLSVLRERATGDGLRLLVTTRPLPSDELARLDEPAGFGRYEIALFNRDQRQTFAHAWFGEPAEATEFLRQSDQSGLSELMAVPLLATVAAVVFEDHPARGLPHSRYELYERYFGLMYESRAASALDGLTERLRGWPDGAALARWLADHRLALVDHLAEAALRGAGLSAAAAEWIRQAGRRPDPAPPDWQLIIASVATSTGLLAHVGTDLKFVHHTFAEHRVASSRARSLPAEFDADHELWAYYVTAARRFPTGEALAVLAHHAFQHGSTAALLDWLAGGDEDSQMLAARLLAEGVPAEPRQFARFAEALRFWTSRTRRASHTADRALAAVRLAASLPVQPDVVDVLQEVASDSTADAELRLGAAEALVSYRTSSAVGAQALHAIAGDPGVRARQRLQAAEALLDLGLVGQRSAIEVLGPLSDDKRLSGYETATVRALHARAGRVLPDPPRPTTPEPPAAGPAATRPPVDDAPRPRLRRVPSWDAVVHRLLRVVVHLDLWRFDDAWLAARGLTRVPRGRPAAETRPRSPRRRPPEPAPRPDTPAEVLARCEAMAAVRPLPPGGVELLRPLLDAPDITGDLLVRAVRTLATSRETRYVQVRVNRLIANRRLSTADALEALKDQAPRFDDITLKLFDEYVNRSANFATGAAPSTIALFAAQGPAFRGRAGDRLRLVLRWGVAPNLQVHAFRLLESFTPEQVPSARTALARLIGSGAVSPVALTQEFLRADTADEAVTVLTEAAGPDFGVCPREWIAAAQLVATSLGGDRDRAAGLLHGMATGAAPADDRTSAAQALLELGEAGYAQGVADLRRIVAEPAVPAAERVVAARALAQLGPDHGPVLAAALRAALREASGTAQRLALARDLAAADPHSRPAALDVVSAVVDDDSLPLPSRREAIRALAQLGPAARRTALGRTADLISTDTLRLRDRLDLAREVSLWALDFQGVAQDAVEALCYRLTGFDALQAARELVQLGESDEERRTKVLVQVAQAQTEIGTSALAARELARFSSMRAAGVRTLATIAEKAAERQLSVTLFYEIASLGETDVAVAGLARVALDRTTRPATRDEAARLLLMLDPCRSAAARTALHALVADPTLTAGGSEWLTEAADYFADRRAR
ncbi:NACHT domain-containing protein [Asanoa siamensis]|uniref:NACHT domain-containing protein n=1 Tax=Asanoa siamensis TaxID=926357 RepID=A0ABQ4CMN1_9ACTN|nr:NACHT domain-containing protein [Asanoa siamensis]GIF72545.1 hypothetical protein Asi02nite_20630 [Asanoa siamensis]